MRRVQLTDEDLKIAAEACERLANRCRNDAKRQPSPITRESLEKHAANCERLAERMKRYRESAR
jgi:hypothetical protein